MNEYSYPFFSEEGKVNCQICGKGYLVIAPRHLATHGVEYSEYKLRYPDAPLSCEEFGTQSKYGKEKNIFVQETLEELDEEVEVLESPVIEEEIDLVKSFEDEITNSGDICVTSKNKILNYLKTHFSNVRKDYMIQLFSPDKFLLFETISDFADPVLKVNIEFPKTFWHNQDAYVKPSRDVTLKRNGWKVIKINSNAPTYEQIRKAIERS
ncbi:MAG: hypothetical protein ACFFG0_00025 [Candidatus Thorarchaeota archaeon]